MQWTEQQAQFILCEDFNDVPVCTSLSTSSNLGHEPEFVYTDSLI